MACCEGMTRWWFEEFSARTECLWRIAGESVAGLVEPLRDRLECSLCHGRLVVRLAPFDGIHFSSAGLIVSFLQSFLVGFLYVWWSFSSIQLRRIAIGMTWFCSRETVFLLRFGKRHPFRSPRKLLPNDPCCTCRWWWWRSPYDETYAFWSMIAKWLVAWEQARFFFSGLLFGLFFTQKNNIFMHHTVKGWKIVRWMTSLVKDDVVERHSGFVDSTWVIS